jgi:DNA invertase Pin-like site-specific DNA recombinase
MLDLNLDTSSYQGRFVVTVMSALAEMERGIIAERQKDIHKDRRDRGLVWGKDLGPKQRISEELRQRIKDDRARGLSLREIARGLDADGLKTAYGGKWTASTINYVLNENTEEQK